MKKSFAMLSWMIVLTMILTCMSAGALFQGSSATNGFYLDFETEDDFLTADGGVVGKVHYYNHVLGNGVGANGTYGALKLAPASGSNEANIINGFSTTDTMPADGKYKLTLKAKAEEGTTPLAFYPLLRVYGANGTVVTPGSYTDYNTENNTFENKSPWWGLANNTAPADGQWHEYSYDVTFNGGNFTLGSQSKVTISSYTSLRIAIRMADDGKTAEEDASTELYIDDISIEPVGISVYPDDYAWEAPYVGEEILPNSRTVTSRYSATIGLGQSAAKSLASLGADVTLDDNGRGTVKTAGLNGDMAYMAVSASGERYVRFQGQAGTSYEFVNKLNDYQIYQVTIRAKAPEFVIDETIEDSLYHIESDGTVTVSSGTNGKIGGALKAFVLRGSVEGARPVFFTGVAAGSKPTLTSEWVDYVGYTYFKPSEAEVWGSVPYIEVNVSGNAGIFYVDELSIKPVESNNLILNGDLSVNVPCKYPNQTTCVAPLGIVPQCEDNTQAFMLKDSTGLYVYNANSATTYREVTTKALLESGKSYLLSVRERMNTSGAKGSLAIDIVKGDAVQHIVANEEVVDTFKVFNFIITPDESVAATNDLDVASIIFKTTRDESATNGKSYYYSYFRLTELPEAFADDITVNGVLTEKESITASWTKMLPGTNSTQLVKVSVGTEETGYSLLHASEPAEPSVSVTLPKGTAGKNVKVEVISYVNGAAVTTASYVSEEAIAEAEEVIPEGVVISDAVKGETAFTANVSYVGAEDAFIVVATYTNAKEMVSLTPFELAKDGTVSPVSVETTGAVYAKIFVFDGTNLANSNIKPMCNYVEIR